MALRTSGLLDALAGTLNGLPDVFSTPQWGGRAYKLPGPGRNVRKPRLLAFVCLTRKGDAVSVSFKLDKDRAETVIRQHAWITRHPFRTLGSSGWVEAMFPVRRHARSTCTHARESGFSRDRAAPMDAGRCDRSRPGGRCRPGRLAGSLPVYPDALNVWLDTLEQSSDTCKH